MCGEEHIHVWNAGAVSVIPYHLRLLSVCALRDGGFAASDEAQTIRLYRGFNGPPSSHSAFEVIDTSPSDILLLAQLADGRLAGADKFCVRVWDTETRACVLCIPHEGHVMDLKVIHSRLAVVAASLTIVE
jgi:WD40 repeat protein